MKQKVGSVKSLLGQTGEKVYTPALVRRFGNMPKHKDTPQALNKRLTSESEINDVFQLLGLSNNEQRVKYLILAQTEEVKASSSRFYTTRLSNDTEPIHPDR